MSGAAQMKTQGYYEALANIQAISFAMEELELYLDTHPNDATAIAQFVQLSQQHDAAEAQFADQYGPIKTSGVKSGAPWGWTATPWPWEV